MKKTTIYGLPLNPLSALEQLKGASFCISYATRKKLGRQLDDAIRLVGMDGVLLVDNGAFSAHEAGVDTMSDENYLNGFAAWANDIADRCPQAIIVIPDVIGGTADQNWDLCWKCASKIYIDRAMPVWHMHEPISHLLRLAKAFSYIAFGSSEQFWNVDKPEWKARINEAFAALDKQAAESGVSRPRVHMMRAQKKHRFHPFDSSDSTNVAVNHNRWREIHPGPNHLARMAASVDAPIQKTAGPEAQHQIDNPLISFVALGATERLTELGFEVRAADGRSINELSDEEIIRLWEADDEDEVELKNAA